MTALQLNKPVPDFEFNATEIGKKKLSDFHGKNLVLYFYPKDATSGCTKEGEDFRDHFKQFEKANTLIFGISRDSMMSHNKFKAGYQFPFELISDESEALCKLFDVIKTKSMYGKKYEGIDRSTFLIDVDGKLRAEWRDVKVPGHVEAVLAEVKKL